MATYTTRLGLTKPDGSENVNVVDLNNNSDVIDSGVGVTVCTSSTRPSAPFQGRALYETDTSVLNVNVGSSAAPSWSDVVKERLAAGTYFSVDNDGELLWGSGGAKDTNLYRSGAGSLKTDDDLEVVGTLTPGAIDLPSTSWTPTWANVTQGTGAVNEGYYLDLGDWIIWQFRLQFGTSPSFSSTIQIDLPAAAWVGGGSGLQGTVGSWSFRDSSGTEHHSGTLGIWSSAGASASFNGAWDSADSKPSTRITDAKPFTVQVDDVLSGGGIYKKA